MKPFILSAHSLAQFTCPKRYYYYKILGRRAVRVNASKNAGHILHRAWEEFNRNPKADTDAIIDQERGMLPLQDNKDYFTADYLKDAFAQLRVEAQPWPEWEVVEVEKRARFELGEIDDFSLLHHNWLKKLEVNETVLPILYEYVRDLVVRLKGKLWIIDLKTTAWDDEAQARVWKLGDQFKGYTWSWNVEHPDEPAAGVIPLRLILRKPVVKKSDKTKPTFEPQFMPFITYSPEILEEWKRSVLLRAQDILRRDPTNPDDWPLIGCYSNCKGCDYQDVCDMNPDQRENYLMQDFFEASDAGKTETLT